MKLRKSDTVKILVGKDKGKSGKILKVFSKENKVLIEGLNLYKKHVRPKKQGEKGQIILLPRPIDASNVAIVCSSCGRLAKIGYKVDGTRKTRICKKCEAKI